MGWMDLKHVPQDSPLFKPPAAPFARGLDALRLSYLHITSAAKIIATVIHIAHSKNLQFNQ